MGFNLVSAGSILLTLALQGAFTSPTPSRVQSDDMIVRRDEWDNGVRIAGDDEVPPPSVVFPTEDDTSDSATRVKPRDDAPTNIPSSDGKYQIGNSLCDQRQDITKYFLYGSDIQKNKEKICDKVFAQPGADGTTESLLAIGAPPVVASKEIRARVKVAATIWHKGSVEVDLTMTNWGMGTDPASKTLAVNLCQDALTYLGNSCNNGITGTDGAHNPPQLSHEAAKGGTVVWNDLKDVKQIEFNMGLKKN